MSSNQLNNIKQKIEEYRDNIKKLEEDIEIIENKSPKKFKSYFNSLEQNNILNKLREKLGADFDTYINSFGKDKKRLRNDISAKFNREMALISIELRKYEEEFRSLYGGTYDDYLQDLEIDENDEKELRQEEEDEQLIKTIKKAIIEGQKTHKQDIIQPTEKLLDPYNIENLRNIIIDQFSTLPGRLQFFFKQYFDNNGKINVNNIDELDNEIINKIGPGKDYFINESGNITFSPQPEPKAKEIIIDEETGEETKIEEPIIDESKDIETVIDTGNIDPLTGEPYDQDSLTGNVGSDIDENVNININNNNNNNSNLKNSKDQKSYNPIHKDAIGLFFGSPPKWIYDLILFRSKDPSWINDAESKRDYVFKQSSFIVKKYGDEIFVNKLVYNKKSNIVDLFRENMELLQLYMAIKGITTYRLDNQVTTTNNDVVSLRLKDLADYRNQLNNIEPQMPTNSVPQQNPLNNDTTIIIDKNKTIKSFPNSIITNVPEPQKMLLAPGAIPMKFHKYIKGNPNFVNKNALMRLNNSVLKGQRIAGQEPIITNPHTKFVKVLGQESNIISEPPKIKISAKKCLPKKLLKI